MARERKMLGPKPGKEHLLIKRARGNPGTVAEALKDVHKTGGYTGFLGEGNIVRKSDLEISAEVLDADDLARKKAIQKLLVKVIEPNPLSSRSTPEMDRRSLVNKLNRLTLAELKRFLPSRIKRLTAEKVQQIIGGAEDLFDEEKAEIQDLYKDLSP